MTSKAPKLFLSPHFQTTSTPLRSSVGSLDTSQNSEGSEPSYVLNITSLGKQYAIATSAPENAIHLVDKETLRFVGSLNGGENGTYPAAGVKKGSANTPAKTGVQAHEGGVTCLKTAASAPGGLISCGKDGSVVLWDTRTANAGVKSEFVSFVMSGVLMRISGCGVGIEWEGFSTFEL